MDPLSITASALAVTEAILGTFKVLQIACGARSEIDALSKRVADFSSVLKTIEHASHRPGLSKGASNDGLLAIRHLLDSASVKLLDLQEILDKKFSTNRSNFKSSINKVVWITERKRVKQLVQDLDVLKIDILSVWSPIISLDISQVLLTLENLSTKSSGSLPTEELESASLVSASPISPTSSFSASSLRPRNFCFNADQRSDTLSGATLTGDTSEEDLAVCTFSSVKMGWVDIRTEKPKQSLLPIHSRPADSHVQQPRRYVVATPKVLQDLLGFLCLVYLHGQHRRPCRCLQLCNCVTTSSMTMTLQFPYWLLSCALTILYTRSSRMGPEFLLRTSKVRPANSEVFHFACTGNVEGLRSLFRHGLASPFDIEYGTGLTALHKAVDWRQFETIDLLRAEGADPFQGDYNGWTPLEAMSQLAFTSNEVLCCNYTALLYKLQTDVLDALQFTELHRFIVGVAKGNILEQLALNPHTVNQPDSGGQTPLFWAVTRGDAAAVSALLKYGADPNACNKLQETPLNWATEAADSSCTILLLSHGAHPTPHSIFGTTPLHYAAWTESSSTNPHVDALLRFGADPNAKNNRGLTPLHYAVPNSSTAAMAKILKAGADIESPDDEGLTPLLEATKNNSILAIRFLLENGANLAARTQEQNSLVHILAEQGTVVTMKALAGSAEGKMSPSCASFLTGIDFSARNAHDQTPRALLLQRRDCEGGLLEAFEELESSIVSAGEAAAAACNPTTTTTTAVVTVLEDDNPKIPISIIPHVAEKVDVVVPVPVVVTETEINI